MRLRCSALVTLFGLALGLHTSVVRAASIEADVEQDGVVISDASGFAEIVPGESATVAIYLVLEEGELVSAFEAGFDLAGNPAVDVTVDLGRVDPGLAPLGVGSWTVNDAFVTGDQARVSLTREEQGGESLVADLLVATAAQEGIFEVVLADRVAAGDLDEEPFFVIVPIGTASGTVLATIAVPEPRQAALQAAALLALGGLVGARRRSAARG